jgi:hypothetical protein
MTIPGTTLPTSLWAAAALLLAASALAFAATAPKTGKPSADVANDADPLAVLSLAPAGAAVRQDGQTAPAGELTYRTFFTLRSAKPEADVPASVREDLDRLWKEKQARDKKATEAGQPSPAATHALQAVSWDLEGDGQPEKFYAGDPAAASGTVWIIFSPARRAVLGSITGSVVFVARETDEGWPRLETYMKTNAQTAVVSEYSFGRTRYAKTRSRVLSLPEIDDYFRLKPPLVEELAEFK